jgi:hypothetical protein
MTARSTTRSLVCLLLVFALCAPVLAIAAPAESRDRATELRGLAVPSSTVLMTRNGARHDHGRLRPSAPPVFTLVSLQGSVSDPGRLAAAVERYTPRPLWSPGPWTGRSPPTIS